MKERCLHCEISERLMPAFQHRPSLENVHALCEVIADIAASTPAHLRPQFCGEARRLFASLMSDVVAGTYKAGPGNILTKIPPARRQ